MITYEELKQQFKKAYEGGDDSDLELYWETYLHCARLNGIVSFDIPKDFKFP